MKHEEIEEYIKSRDLDVMQYQLVIDAMYYTEKTIIERACSWLEQHRESYDMYDAWSGDYVNFKSLIIDFRKAMEE